MIRYKYGGGFPGTRVNPSVKNLPPNATAIFDPQQPVTSQIVTLTVSTALTDSPMLYKLEIGGTVVATGAAVCPGFFMLTLLPPVRRVTLTAAPDIAQYLCGLAQSTPLHLSVRTSMALWL